MAPGSSSRPTRRWVALIAMVLTVIVLTGPQAMAAGKPPHPSSVRTASSASTSSTGSTASTGSSVAASASPPKAWILVDVDTGRVLDQHEVHVLRRPASTIKLLSVLTAERHLPPDARITVSPLAASMPALRIGLKAGQTWPFADLLSSSVVISANDAIVAIAEASGGGSLDTFASQMQDTARSLGVVDAPQLSDPAGLDDNLVHGGGDWISAWDLALVGRAAIADPTITAAADSALVRFDDPEGHSRKLRNHNKLLERYPGANGLKTGFTNAAGNTLVATATRGGRTMMVVVLDSPNLYDPVIKLMDRGFATSAASETGPLLAPALPHLSTPRPPEVVQSGAVEAPNGPSWPAAAIGVLGVSMLVIGRRRMVVGRRQ